MDPEITPSTQEVVKPEVEFVYNEDHIKLAREDFAEFVNNTMTLIWNSRERLLKKGMANYVGPFLEIYSIMYESCLDNCPLERELWDRSDKVLTAITGNGPDLSYLEDKEDEYHFKDDEDENVKAEKLVANAEKLMGIILELNKKSPVKKDAEEA